MNNWIRVVPACGIALILGTVQVPACLTDQAETVNTVLVSENTIHVEEEFDPPAEPVPGLTFTKKPEIVNDGLLPCYVRARILFSSQEAASLCEPLQLSPSWSQAEDGYCYYADALSPGARTEPVFNTVSFRRDISPEELSGILPFEILVYAESVRAGEEGAQEAWARITGGGGLP